jgi:hypothetical protein
MSPSHNRAISISLFNITPSIQTLDKERRRQGYALFLPVFYVSLRHNLK